MNEIKKKILVVDDDKPIATAMELKLESAGFDVKVVLDGEAALSAIEREKFDLIILDLVLPKVSGFEVLEKMNQSGRKYPVVIASNLSQEVDVNKAREYGVVDFFVKSDTPLSKIVDNVNNIINRSSSR